MSDSRRHDRVLATGDHRPWRLSAWYAYVAGWVVAWLALVTRPGAWALAAVHWPVAVVMLCGSFVAGSTPMGGGSVAFPALVLLFGHPPAMARDFGFAIQSVGMTSALVFIAARGIDVERRMLAWAFAGSIGGLAIGTWVLAPVVPAAWVKLVFATLWLVFGAWLVDGLRRVRTVPDDGRPAAALGLVAGAAGGLVAALIGVGVEMAVYAALVLGRGWDAKAAVPTAVCAMALASPVGLALRAAGPGIDAAVFPAWLAAAPVVLLGAPAGAFVATRVPRVVLVGAIAVLCVVQFAWTVGQVRPLPAQWAGVVAIAAATAAVLWRRNR